MAYVRGKGELVGVYTFAEIQEGQHLPALNKRMVESGLQHTYAEFALENCVPYGLKLYLVAECDRRDDRKEETET